MKSEQPRVEPGATVLSQTNCGIIDGLVRIMLAEYNPGPGAHYS